MAGKSDLLMVGTAKGLFILRKDAGSDKWNMTGPYFAGRLRRILRRP